MLSRFIAIEEFSGRASMSTASHGAFAEMPWPFAYAEMTGSAKTVHLKDRAEPPFYIRTVSQVQQL
jgi:hypothetical protein